MGRPRKIVDAQEWNAMKEAEEKREEASEMKLPTEEKEATPDWVKPKKARKIKSKITVNDMVAEFEIKKQKLVDRYIKKIHKLMGI